jgi:photosystem II stability/assembly factor-like uncharacterized protein
MVASAPLIGPRLPAHGTAGVVGRPATPRGGTVGAVACGSSTACWAVGSVPSGFGPLPLIDATADGGGTWVAQRTGSAGAGQLSAVACSDRRYCMAVGARGTATPAGLVMVTTDGGRRWRAMGAPATSVEVGAVSCATPTDCLVLSTGGSGWWSAATSDGGRVWQRGGTLPPGFGGPGALSCRGTTCLSAGYTTLTGGKGEGAVARSTDGGTNWSAATVPSGTGPLHDLTCPTRTRCLAVGTSSPNLADVTPAPSDVLASTDGGLTWAPSPAPSGVGDATGVSCATASRCATVGTAWTFTNPPNPVGAVADSTDGGRKWRSPSHQQLPAGLEAVVCPTSDDCLAVGGYELARFALPAPRGR